MYTLYQLERSYRDCLAIRQKLADQDPTLTRKVFVPKREIPCCVDFGDAMCL